MKQYVISVMLVGIVASIVSLLAPEGGLKDHVRLAVGIVMVSVCILPLTSVISQIRELDIGEIVGENTWDEQKEQEYESVFQSEYREAEIENLKEGIKTMLFQKYDIGADECEVSLKSSAGEDGKRRLERIFINFYGDAIWKNTSEIEDYLGELFDCEVVTAVG